MRTRAWHRRLESFVRGRAAKRIQTILVRDLDVITLRPKRKVFRVSRPPGSKKAIITHDAHALFDYVHCTGDTRDPLSREPLTLSDLRRLEAMVGRTLPRADSLVRQRDMQLQHQLLVEHLIDEVLTTGSVEALSNLHQVASSHEMRVAQHAFLRAGVMVVVRGPSLPILSPPPLLNPPLAPPSVHLPPPPPLSVLLPPSTPRSPPSLHWWGRAANTEEEEEGETSQSAGWSVVWREEGEEPA